jgi:hypothetical protein
MVQGVSDLITGLLVVFPPWVLGVVGVVGVVTLGPRWIESMRDKQLRGWVRRMIRADADERQRLSDLVMEVAGSHPGRLSAVVHHAIHYDQRALRDRALAALAATGGAPEEVKRLRERIDKPRTKFRDPIEAAVRIEQLRQDGLLVAADEQLEIARAAFPGDPELEALARTMREASSAEVREPA